MLYNRNHNLPMIFTSLVVSAAQVDSAVVWRYSIENQCIITNNSPLFRPCYVRCRKTLCLAVYSQVVPNVHGKVFLFWTSYLRRICLDI